MATKPLSNRESEIVALATDGFTNEAIAVRLGVSIGTVNTYWARIKVKTGGAGRTDTVAKIVGVRAEQALHQAKIDHAGIERVMQAGMQLLILERETELFNLRAAVGMLQLATEVSRATLWAVDRDLRIQMVQNPRESDTLSLALGKTLYELLGTRNPPHPGIAGHLETLQGRASTFLIVGTFNHSWMRTAPIFGERGEVIGCVGMIISTEPNSKLAKP